MRKASINRNTKETSIKVAVNLDGSGKASIKTGIGFLDHMMEQIAKHSLIDIDLKAKGDLHIDLHHTTEDSGIAFGEALSKKTSVQHEIARSRCDIEQCRLLVLAAAEKMDKYGIDAARDYISMLKIVAPKMCEDVSSRAIQVFGGMGVSQDTPLAHIFTTSRFCRIADGPDEVHMSQLAKLTMRSMSVK